MTTFVGHLPDVGELVSCFLRPGEIADKRGLPAGAISTRAVSTGTIRIGTRPIGNGPRGSSGPRRRGTRAGRSLPRPRRPPGAQRRRPREAVEEPARPDPHAGRASPQSRAAICYLADPQPVRRADLRGVRVAAGNRSREPREAPSQPVRRAGSPRTHDSRPDQPPGAGVPGHRPAGSGTGSFGNDGVSRSVTRTGDTASVLLIARLLAPPPTAPTACGSYLASTRLVSEPYSCALASSSSSRTGGAPLKRLSVVSPRRTGNRIRGHRPRPHYRRAGAACSAPELPAPTPAGSFGKLSLFFAVV